MPWGLNSPLFTLLEPPTTTYNHLQPPTTIYHHHNTDTIHPGLILPSLRHPSRPLSLSSIISRIRGGPSNPPSPTDLARRVLQKSQLKANRNKNRQSQNPPTRGHLPRSSLLHPKNIVPGVDADTPPSVREAMEQRHNLQRRRMAAERNAALRAQKLDPEAPARRAWERERVIEGIRARGRVSAEIKRLRSERQHLYRSSNLPTSTKKLTKLMHQIAGKTVEEAAVQLRFSKKKVARDVLRGLLTARDEAVVSRGMGRSETARSRADGARVADKQGSEGVEIELKRGGTKRVVDEREIYVDQAWVGKGEHRKSPEYRAKGQVNILTHRTTSEYCYRGVYGWEG
ncbi:hypothetical protein EJ04DRAFT_58655 [Polyplosphaeria fusca]|uniref:Uncharacterized protein n=1 Tax=Polyplosphaeria fusca TaxID=682080 RepID=A0A9P4UYB0_9PLEO|nr:hypothetical protein EJ04DRAFT_58655 [Polyplosphaeria fusca]